VNSDGAIWMKMGEKKNISDWMDSMHLSYSVGNEISKNRRIYESGILTLAITVMKLLSG